MGRFEELLARANAQPHKTTPRHIEDDLQIACVNWFSYQYQDKAQLLHHSPNGGKRDSREAARFKRMGVRPGFPDLVLLIASGGYNYLCLELKTQTGKQSDYQKQYQQLVEAQGGKYVVIRSLQQFMDAINDYLK